VDLVNVEISVSDARGNPVAGLRRQNFRILDEGMPQTITHFASVEAPAVLFVLVEASPAVYLIRGQHLAGVYALADGLAPDDQVALASYGDAVRLLLPLTPEKAALTRAVARLEYSLGMTDLRLFESVAAVLDRLAPLPGRKALVLLTTGLDTAGAPARERLEEMLRASDVVLYAVALGGALRDYRAKAPADESRAPALSFEEADKALERLAQVTGGRAFFPRRVTEFTGIYAQIARTLRHQYSLGFAPPARDARPHRLEVQLLDDRGRVVAPAPGGPRYRLRHRPSYLAPQ
jgi:VWFA-related protein